jgi:sterol 3beta-glucosyltransferase
MKITIFAAGSRGDIQPCVALGLGLQRSGYRVELAAPSDFADFVQKYDVPFAPLRGDVQQIMASDTGRRFMEEGSANPLASIRTIRRLLAPVVMQMADDAYAACRNTEAIISLGVLSAFGQSIAEALRVPILNLEPTPLLPTRAFAAPGWPIQRNLGGWHNYASGLAMLQVIWQWYRPSVNEFRRTLKLSALNFRHFYRVLRSTPMLSAYSPAILPHPADWPEHAHLTGYFFLETAADWQPSPELLAFLEAGAPPVYIGFGSMAGRNPERLAGVVVDALAQSGQRGLLLTGWGGLRAEALPANVFVADAVPHRWLFPRMAAVVHHGGAGTTAEGLRAGVPSIIVPFAFDQSFWGERVRAMGLGPSPILQKKLTAERLASAIQIAVSDAGMAQRARVCGEAIRGENGVAGAVKLVARYLGEPRDS